MCLICQWSLSSSSPWWHIQKHGAVPNVFTESRTQSINLTHEALHASGFGTHMNPLHECMYTWTHRTLTGEYMFFLHKGYHAIVSLLTYKWRISRCAFDSDLSSMLNLSVKFIFLLTWPAAVVAHGAMQRDGKEWAILYHSRPKIFPFGQGCSVKAAITSLTTRFSFFFWGWEFVVNNTEMWGSIPRYFTTTMHLFKCICLQSSPSFWSFQIQITSNNTNMSSYWFDVL